MLAFVVAIAWPLSGIPLLAAALAIVAVGARARPRPPLARRPPRRRLAPVRRARRGRLVLAIAGAALAESHPAQPPDAAAVSDRRGRPRATAPRASSALTGEGAAGQPAGGRRDATTTAATAGTTGRRAAGGRRDDPTTRPPRRHGDARRRAAGDTAPATTPDDAAATTASERPTGGRRAPTERGEAPTGRQRRGADDTAGDAPADAAPAGARPRATRSQAPSRRRRASPGDAESFVRAYYRALDEKRFDGRVGVALARGPHAASAASRAGRPATRTTLYSKPRDIVVTDRRRRSDRQAPARRARPGLRRRAQFSGHVAAAARVGARGASPRCARVARGAARNVDAIDMTAVDAVIDDL